jgi:hypothetical protein
MAANRQSPTPSNYGAEIPDDTYADDVSAEIVALWGTVAETLGSVAGTNTVTASCTPALLAYTAKGFWLKPAAANTGSVTLNVDGLGAKALKTQAGAALAGGELNPAQYYLIFYTGSEFRMAFTAPAGALPALPLNYVSGFETANNASDANNDIDIAAGQARDAGNAVNVIGAAMTKRLPHGSPATATAACCNRPISRAQFPSPRAAPA